MRTIDIAPGGAPLSPSVGPAPRERLGRPGLDGRLACDAVWVRFAVLPLRLLGSDPDVAEMWGDGTLREAVSLASPSLAAAVDRYVENGGPGEDRILVSLRSYLSRMACRATPFGLMAGVFSARLGDAEDLRCDLTVEAHVRSEQISAPAVDLTTDERVVAHPGIEEVEEGYVVPPRTSARSPADRLRFVRSTPTMRYALEHLRSPGTVEEKATLLARGSGQPTEAWIAYLRRLDRVGLLVRVRPHGGPLPWVRTLVADRSGGRPMPASPEDTVDEPSGGTQVMTSVDAFAARADAVSVPREIGVQAAAMCHLLAAVNPVLPYPSELQEMSLAFRKRFGPGTEVGLVDAFSAVHGIALKAPGTVSREKRWHPERDRAVQALIFLGIRTGEAVELTPDVVEELRSWAGDPAVPDVPAQEVCVRAHRGPGGFWTELLFTGVPGSLGGRFVHLLPPDSAERIRLQTAAVDGLFDPFDVLEMAVTATAKGRRIHSVIPLESVRTDHVCLNPGTDPGGSPLHGPESLLLSVDSDSGRFRIRSARTGRFVHVVQPGMVQTAILDPLEAFVLRVCGAQFAYARPFDWGSFAESDYLPGLRRGPVHLSSPRWLLAGRAQQQCSDERFLKRWMDERGVPGEFVARKPGSDRGVLIRQGKDEGILTRLIQQAGRDGVELKSSPDALGPGLLRDRAGDPHVTEVVVTVTSDRFPADRRLPMGDTRATGSPGWRIRTGTAVELRLPAVALPAFVTGPLDRWLASGNRPGWLWWEAEVDADPLVRICLSDAGSDADAGDLVEEVWRWGRRLRADGDVAGVAVVEHHLHRGLFDDPEAMRLAHGFFAADAAVALEAMKAARGRPDLRLEAAIAHVQRLLSGLSADDVWTRACLARAERRAGGTLYRQVRHQVEAAGELSGHPRWRSALSDLVAGGGDAAALILPLTRLSLNRMCIPGHRHPEVYGVVRRLHDKRVHTLQGDEHVHRSA